MIFVILFIIVTQFCSSSTETIKHLHEISINEELPIDSIVTYLTDKIPNLDQSQQYDLVTPLSVNLDLFAVDHQRRALIVKHRIDFEQLCSSTECIIPVSIAVANRETIDVYTLPIRIINIDDNPVKFSTNRTVIEIEENDENWSTRTFPLLSATDADGDPINYSLFLYNWSAPTGLFELLDLSGNLVLRPMRSFDREQQHLYALRLVAHSGQEKKNDATMDVIVVIKDVNDNVPQCEQNRTEFIIDNLLSTPTILINATDRDEGDNAKLEFILHNASPAFILDRNNGLLKFDYNKWIPSNESVLIVNVSDHGKPFHLSTQCRIELKFTFLFDIKFNSENGDKQISVTIRDVRSPLGHLTIIDNQQRTPCFDCLVRLSSALPDLLTTDLQLNLTSKSLLRILANPSLTNEDLPLLLTVDTWRPQMPAITSRRQFSLVLHFNKQQLLARSDLILLEVNEFDEKIVTNNLLHFRCHNQSDNLILIDESKTFEMDSQQNLIVKSHLQSKRQRIYELIVKSKGDNRTSEDVSCLIHLQIVVIDPYSSSHSYFSESFYILSGNSIADFILPLLPEHVNYVSSVPALIAIDERNGSIDIRALSLFDTTYYDFGIRAIDSQTPSLSSEVPIRIFFGINRQAPRLINDVSIRKIQIPPSGFLFQVQANDPDLSLNDSRKLLPPSVEYGIDGLSSFLEIQIERFSGRIFAKRSPLSTLLSSLNLTVLMTDFGQPHRLTTRHFFKFDLNWNNDEIPQPIPTSMTTSFVLIGAGILILVIILSGILLIFNSCCCSSSSSRSRSSNSTIKKKPVVATHQTSWKNISPTAPDTRLIDNEYVTSASLPRVTTREQRVYPTLPYEHHHQRRLLSHSSLDKIHVPPPFYSSSHVKPDHLSMTDINKYLERFEKIYNDSSSQQHLHGSVV